MRLIDRPLGVANIGKLGACARDSGRRPIIVDEATQPLGRLLARCGHVVWKKVRVFEKKDPASDHWHERGWKTMSLLDYHEYLQQTLSSSTIRVK